MAFDKSILGVEENIPKVSFTEYSGLLQCEPKWGKTTFASLYDNCVLLACEPGYKAKKINFRKINQWEDFRDFVSLLEEHRESIGDDIKTIVIDTVDRLYPFCQKYIVKKYNRKKSADSPKAESIGDVPHGKGWTGTDEEFLEQISKVLELGFTFLFVTHSKTKTISPKNGIPYDVYIPTMPDRCSAIVYPLVDFIINGQRTTVIEDGASVAKREIILRGNQMACGGSRVGNISERIVFDTEQEAMDKFRESFKKAITEEISKGNKDVDIDKLEEEQKNQKDVMVAENLLKNRELPNIIKEIKKIMKDKLKSKVIDSAFIINTLSNNGFNTPDEIDNPIIAKKILEEFERT